MLKSVDYYEDVKCQKSIFFVKCQINDFLNEFCHFSTLFVTFMSHFLDKRYMESAPITPGKQRPDVRVYLEEKVFPILTQGLDELLTAVEEREKKIKDGEEVPEINSSFFLARYLMRCAQQKSNSTPSEYASTQEQTPASARSAENEPKEEETEEKPAEEEQK